MKMKRIKWLIGTTIFIIAAGCLITWKFDTKNEQGVTVAEAAGSITSANYSAKKSANMKGIDYSNAWNDDGYTARGCTTGNNFYYSIYNTLYKLNLKTGKNYLVKEFDCFSIRSVKYYNNRLYVVLDEYEGTGGSYPYIESMDTDGNNQIRLGVGYSITIANDRIYYIKQTKEGKDEDEETFPTQGIYSMGLAGQASAQREQELLKDSSVRMAVCDGETIFYTTDKGTYQMTASGENCKKILSASATVLGFYNHSLYYETYNYKKQIGTIYAKNLRTGKKKKIMKGCMQYVTKIDVLTGKLYSIKDVKYGKKCPVYQYDLKTGKIKTVAKQKKLYSIGVYGTDIMLTYTNDSSDTISKMVHLKDKKTTKLAMYYVS